MAIKKVEAKHVDAAGIMFYAKNTGNFLSIYRAANVVDGNCWCGGGGKIEEGETPEEAAKREIDEELGFDCDAAGCELFPLYTYESDELTFHNFLGVVDEQFFPQLNWESDGYAWTKLHHLPTPMHYGMRAIVEDPDAQAVLMEHTGVNDYRYNDPEDASVTKANIGKYFTIEEVRAIGRKARLEREARASGFHKRLKGLLGQ